MMVEGPTMLGMAFFLVCTFADGVLCLAEDGSLLRSGFKLEHLKTTASLDRYLYLTSLTLLGLIAVLGNFLVAFTLVKKKHHLSSSNRLLFSLIVSNCLLAAGVIPFAVISGIRQQWIFGVFWCSFTGFIMLLICAASSLTLAAIAIDRCWTVLHPFIYPSATNKTVLMLLGVWFEAAVITVPPLFGWSRFSYNSAASCCLVQWEISISFTLVFLVCCFLVPLTVLASCYLYVFRVARSKYQKIQVGTISRTSTPTSLMQSSSTDASVPLAQNGPTTVRTPWTTLGRRPSWLSLTSRSPLKGFAVVCIVVGAFLVTWGPYVVAAVLESIWGRDEMPVWYQRYSVCSLYASAVTHPLVYGLLSKPVRQDLWSVVCHRRRRAAYLNPSLSRRAYSSLALVDYSPKQVRAHLPRRSNSFDCTGTVDSDVLDFLCKSGTISDTTAATFEKPKGRGNMPDPVTVASGPNDSAVDAQPAEQRHLEIQTTWAAYCGRYQIPVSRWPLVRDVETGKCVTEVGTATPLQQSCHNSTEVIKPAEESFTWKARRKTISVSSSEGKVVLTLLPVPARGGSIDEGIVSDCPVEEDVSPL